MSVANNPPTPSTLWGVPLKLVSLVTLTVQNSSLILVMHYSRVMPTSSNTRYFASTAVLVNEVLKFVICTSVAIYQQGLKNTWNDVAAPDCWKLAIPAVLYTLQNSLQYAAVSNLSAATFQVTYQMKILTTALFSVIMLHRALSRGQWTSLVLLTLGIATVQIPQDVVASLLAYSTEYLYAQTGWSPIKPAQVEEEQSSAISHKLKSVVGKFRGRSASSEAATAAVAETPTSHMNAFSGLVAVSIACLLSGLAGVYFEKVLKGSSATLWIRNIQLSAFSIVPALVLGVVIKDGAQIAEHGFFAGYNPVVWAAIMLQAVGGIVVALCVKFADNIAKNFATSVSILISSVVSVYAFDFQLTPAFVAGSAVVIYATYLYSRPTSPRSLSRVEKIV